MRDRPSARRPTFDAIAVSLYALSVVGLACSTNPAGSTAIDASAPDATLLLDASVGTGSHDAGSLDSNATDASPPSSDLQPIDPCLNNASSQLSSSCGGSPQLKGAGDPNTLYRCQHGASVSQTPCEFGCASPKSGTPDLGYVYPDYCKLRLPFECNTRVRCTQGNFGDICGTNNGDHANWPEQFAWDFGDVTRGVTRIVAARSGRVAAAFDPDPSCVNGCTEPFGSAAFWACCNPCIFKSGHVKVDHLDGTLTIYGHLDSLAPGLTVGASIKAGDFIGYAGTSGCSSGPHLHFMSMMDKNPPQYNQYDCYKSTYECTSIPSSFVDVGVNQGDPVCDVSATGWLTSMNTCK